ncbi:MAG: hypothetical protein IJ491_01875 [Clostridia bacterium]|nr:hypothetical protein [Clostridia bacterium]
MKKIICLSLALCLLLTLAACGKKKDEGTLVAYKDDEGNIVTEYVSENEEDKEKNKNDIDNEVKVTLPLVLIDSEYRNDIDAYCEANGFIKGKINEKDQTVTITMRALTYDLNLVRIGTKVMSNIGSAIDSGEYPYVQKLESYSENFDEIVMLVDGEGYKADKQHSLLPYYLGECGMYYQLYTTENEYRCTVKIKDAKTGEIIDEEYYETDNYGKEY